MKIASITVLIPVLNQEKLLRTTVENLREHVKNAEIIILWDVTKPELREELMGEANILKNMGARIIFRFNARGFGSALRLGFEKSSGDAIVVMMGDGCDDPETINQMADKMEHGYDLVAGSRFMAGGIIMGSSKGHISKLVSFMIRTFSSLKCTDITNAFRMYSRKVVKNVKTDTNSFDITTEITLKAAKQGFRITEIPTTWINRDGGKTAFSVTKEAKRYFNHFLFATIFMPSLLTKILLIALGSALALFFYSLI